MTTAATPTLRTTAPWHKASFALFLHDRLPGLLAERLPLAGYRVAPAGDDPYACTVFVTLSGKRGDVDLRFENVPQPGEDGVFQLDGVSRVVLPIASSEKLDVATVACVGEQLYDFVAARLVGAPRDVPWDASTAEAWVPLGQLVRDFLAEQQPLEDQNWLSRAEHLRRIAVADCGRPFDPGQIGRACPIQTPEGPRVGRILHVATGATIRGGRIELIDSRPQCALSVGASMLPFLEHSDPNRSLMGANMMRQWLVPPDPEPALVQTGNEPAAERFWCGRNLLTAYLSLGLDTYEDGIVVSASAAARLGYPRPLEPGDKLSNRAGAKGVVSRILSDERMPQMADGTIVDLVYSPAGVPSRMNLAQLKEAVAGRIARAEGAAFVAPPFEAPKEAELRQRLARAGLPESGMERLTLDGRILPRASTVGWVYWGKTHHVASDKLRVTVPATEIVSDSGIEPPLDFRHADYIVLRDLGATANLKEIATLRSAARADELLRRLDGELLDPPPGPTPLFEQLTRRLELAGIRAERVGEQLRFRFRPPEGDVLRLAEPVPHPWRTDRALEVVGVSLNEPTYRELEDVNARARRVLSGDSPPALRTEVMDRLARAASAYIHALVTPAHLAFATRTTFVARAVLAPGDDLAPDQVGLPEDVAWALFGASTARDVGRDAIRDRTPAASAALDAAMAGRWVVVHRSPATYSSFVALRPVRRAGRVIRLHPVAGKLLDADHDGDQVAVFLPLTDAAQREAAERLSLAAHFRRDPGLMNGLMAYHDAPLGLALLSLTDGGRRQIAEATGGALRVADDELLARSTVARHVRDVIERDGCDAGMALADRLMRLGFDAAARSGASISPFLGSGVLLPPVPAGASAGAEGDVSLDADAWAAYRESVLNAFLARTDYDDADVGPLLVAIKSGSRASPSQIYNMIAPHLVRDDRGQPRAIRHGWSQGLAADEWLAHTAGARFGLGQVHADMAQGLQQWLAQGQPKGFHVLARAIRSTHPGIVFAQAAAAGESDPLTDLDARLFVGVDPAGAG